jgi:hypothetical protein
MERAPNFLFFCCFHLILTFESIKELGSMSHGIRALVELNPLIGEFQWHRKKHVSQYMKPWWKKPPRTYMFHLRPLGRRNKRILKIKKTVTTVMTMKMKRSNQP